MEISALMMKNQAVKLFVLLLATLLLAPVHAEEFLFRDFDGKEQVFHDQLADGQWTVVMIWAHDCPACNEEVQAWDLFHADHEESDARVLGLSLDGAAGESGAREFLERHEPDFKNLIGEPRDVARMVSKSSGRPLYGTPTFLVFSPGRKLVAMQVGPLNPSLLETYMRENSLAGVSE
jgi:thiol-disulfide isomerase/thioredoxin